MIRQGKDSGFMTKTDDVLTLKQSAILSLMTVLFALALPLSAIISPATDILSWIICIVFGVWIMMTSRKFSSIVILGFVVTFFASYTGSASSVALVIGAVSACGIYSAIASASRGWQLSLLALIPALTLALTYAFTWKLELAILSLTLFLPALVTGIVLRQGGSRVSAITGFAITAAIEIGIAAIIGLYMTFGTISFEVIKEAASYFRIALEEILTFSIESVGEEILTEDVTVMITEMAIETTNMLPGLTCMMVISVGFFSQKIQHTVFEKFEIEHLQNRSGAPIKASVAAALVYVAAYICSFTTGASSAPSFVAVVAGNIGFMLLPLLLCVGFGFMTSLPRKIGVLALAAWLGAGAVAYLLSSSLIDIIALVGAFYTLLVSIEAWAGEHYSKGGDQ